MLFVDNFFVQVHKKGDLLIGTSEIPFLTFSHSEMNNFFEKCRSFYPLNRISTNK